MFGFIRSLLSAYRLMLQTVSTCQILLLDLLHATLQQASGCFLQFNTMEQVRFFDFGKEKMCEVISVCVIGTSLNISSGTPVSVNGSVGLGGGGLGMNVSGLLNISGREIKKEEKVTEAE